MIRRELGFFVGNGIISVAIAYGVYRGLVASGLMIELANGIAYLAGMAYGFIANKRLTFRDEDAISTGKVARYALLHTGTLLVNVGVNSAMLGILRGLPGDLPAAFLAAIAVSTILNFLGLKCWVFKQSADASAGMNSTRADVMRKIFLRGPYFPRHEDNLMSSEGSVALARQNFIERRFRNLDVLLRSRYAWMNRYLAPGQTIVEIGAGAGFSPLYLTQMPTLTDAADNPWIDRFIDATHMELESSSVDVLIASHNIHHFYSPYQFFRECERVLKADGILLIQELNTSLLMRSLLRLMRHEGWSYDVDVFDEQAIVNDKHDLWSANCAVPELLFADVARFEQTFPDLKVETNELCECLVFPLSGGVISKTRVPELPGFLLKAALLLDRLLVRVAPGLFALGRRVVIRKQGE